MNDLISRYDMLAFDEKSVKAIIDNINRILWIIEEASYGVTKKWIPCEKKLPKEREWVLCSCRAKMLQVLRLNDTGDWETIYPNVKYMSGFVLAWMPLPELYKGE